MNISLTRKYPSILLDNSSSYGGNQHWLGSKTLQGWGCGLIAVSDILLYLMRIDDITHEEYIRFVNSIKKYFPMIPKFGINGLHLAFGLNLCLRHFHLPYKCFWGISKKKFSTRFQTMLKKNIPVLLSIGPSIIKFRKKNKLTLYERKSDETYIPSTSTKDHYVVATGIEDDYISISSWGKKYYINLNEYERYIKRSSNWIFSNIMYITSRIHP